MIIHFNNSKAKMLIIGFAIVIVLLFIYLHFGYQKLGDGIRSIKVVLNKPTVFEEPIVYITEGTQVNQDFERTFRSHTVNDSVILVDLNKETYIRQFRMYFQSSTENVEIKAIWLQSNENEWKLDLREFRIDDILILEQNTQILKFKVLSKEGYSYLESPRFYYPTDFTLIAIATAMAVLLSCSLILFFSRIQLFSVSKSISISELSVFLFIFSIFLPQRYFNIALVISALLVIRNFRIQYFLSNKTNILMIIFYTVILINYFTISPDYNFKAIEKYTMFLVLPVYATCIRDSKVLIYFFFTALIIGVGLLLGALIDISIFKNLEVVSFENFTRTIHPVYYSYLLAFSILYIELNVFVTNKYLIQSLLIVLLVLSSSKLIIFVVLLWFLFVVKKSVRLILVPFVILILFFFTPLNERFGSIIKPSDLTVITDDYIQNPDDLRLNGFTLRVILWQENLNSVNNFLFGNGVSLSGTRYLELSLMKRGLTNHLQYNAHNQYITTIYKTGLLGFIILFAILAYCILQGIKTKNMTLVYFTTMMSLAMMSESIFERVSGIAFFCLVLLLLSNSDLNSRREMIHSV